MMLPHGPPRSFGMRLATAAASRPFAWSSWARITCASAESRHSSTTRTTPTKRLTMDSISDSLKRMEYAVRGKVVVAADELADELSLSSKSSYDFSSITYTNIGNPHAVGQKALTWPRQVQALLQLPSDVGIDHPSALELFPSDAVERAREMKHDMNGAGVGAYSHSKGVRSFRRDVKDFIEARDGLTGSGASADVDVNVAVDVEDIFLTTGASDAIGMVMTALIKDKQCGIMIPIPQYPIYSALLELQNGRKVSYYLNEQSSWSANIQELQRSLADAKAQGVNVTAFVLINPGNPTGQVLTPDEVREVVLFCARNHLVLLADEVYQENVYNEGDEFYSCRRAANDLGLIESQALELFSFHSTSKGLFGECGQRGGYVEMIGIDSDVKDCLYKLASTKLCSNVSGQAMVSLMCRGPKKGDVSYETHEQEKRVLFEGLKQRAEIVSKGLDSIPGFSCEPAAGAMYCFPRVTIPPGAIEEAKRQAVAPDALYAIDLLKSTGVCVVPASGFGQEEGRFGFRTTFLPVECEMVVEKIREHYKKFCDKYAA